jgi:copper chaperone NosL
MNAAQSHQAHTIGKPLLQPIMAMMVTILVCAIAFMGCSSERGLPTVVADRTTCSNCKMLVSETAHAAAFRVGDDDQIFDDIGCLLDRLADDVSLNPKQIWARDIKSDQWIDAKTALFAYSKQHRTPMGFGYIAFHEKSEAEAATAKVGGNVLNGFGELQAHYVKNDHANN